MLHIIIMYFLPACNCFRRGAFALYKPEKGGYNGIALPEQVRSGRKGGLPMNKKSRNPRYAPMYRAILALDTEEDLMAFFDDLCTVTELQAMEQRFQVAELLEQGRVYTDILEITGASSTTVSRVNRSLQYGKDGYGRALRRLKEAGE